MTRLGIEQLLYMMDEAFKDNPFHSLMKNLGAVRDDDWEWLPTDGSRSILHIVQHVAYAKYMYDNHAFGDRSLTWDNPANVPETSTPRVLIGWLSEAQERLRRSVAAFGDDSELLQARMAPWGTEANTRWLINVTVQHDLYHSGEINHLRALHQGNDE